MLFRFLFTVVGLAALATCREPWTLVWSDEFNGEAGGGPDPKKWGFNSGDGSQFGLIGWGNSELQYYTDSPENCATDGEGHLKIVARWIGGDSGSRTTECYYGACNFTSAKIVSQGKFSQKYGRFEARLKIPKGKGLWPAFWMLGDDITSVGWPGCGEIDIAEFRGSEPGRVGGALHGPGYAGGTAVSGSHNLPPGRSFADDFHTFAIDWAPNVTTWSVDGAPYQSFSTKNLRGHHWVFDHPFHLLLNLAVGGHYDGHPDATTEFPQALVIDYVRVYNQTRSNRSEWAKGDLRLVLVLLMVTWLGHCFI